MRNYFYILLLSAASCVYLFAFDEQIDDVYYNSIRQNEEAEKYFYERKRGRSREIIFIDDTTQRDTVHAIIHEKR